MDPQVFFVWHCIVGLDADVYLFIEIYSVSVARRCRAAHHSREARQLRPNIYSASCRPYHTMHGISPDSQGLQVQLPAGVGYCGGEHRQIQFRRCR